MRQIDIASKEFGGIAETLLSEGTAISFVARGWSMYPTIQNGDTLTVEPSRNRPPSLRDVVLARLGAERIVVHRIVQLPTPGDPDFVTLRGDASRDGEEQVPIADVWGRVTRVERRGVEVPLAPRAPTPIERAIRVAPVRVLEAIRVGFRHRLHRGIESCHRCGPLRRLARWAVRPSIRVRTAVIEDADAIAAVQREANPLTTVPTVARHIAEFGPHGLILVGLLGRRLVGTVIVARGPDNSRPPDTVEWTIVGLVVRFRFRGLGVGERLIRRVLEAARQARVPRLRIDVFPENTAAVRLYRKLGFRELPTPLTADNPVTHVPLPLVLELRNAT